MQMTPPLIIRTHRCFSQSYLVLDYLHDVFSRGRRVKLDGMVLSIHEMKPSVYQPPVDGAQYLFSRRGPLSPPGALGFGHALQAIREYI